MRVDRVLLDPQSFGVGLDGLLMALHFLAGETQVKPPLIGIWGDVHQFFVMGGRVVEVFQAVTRVGEPFVGGCGLGLNLEECSESIRRLLVLLLFEVDAAEVGQHPFRLLVLVQGSEIMLDSLFPFL